MGEEWQAKALAQERELELEEEGEEKKTRQLGTHFQQQKSPLCIVPVYIQDFFGFIYSRRAS